MSLLRKIKHWCYRIEYTPSNFTYNKINGIFTRWWTNLKRSLTNVDTSRVQVIFFVYGLWAGCMKAQKNSVATHNSHLQFMICCFGLWALVSGPCPSSLCKIWGAEFSFDKISSPSSYARNRDVDHESEKVFYSTELSLVYVIWAVQPKRYLCWIRQKCQTKSTQKQGTYRYCSAARSICSVNEPLIYLL